MRKMRKGPKIVSENSLITNKRLKGYDYIPSRVVIPNARTEVSWIVLHTIENNEHADQARKFALWAKNDPTCKVSFHFVVDDKEAIQCAELTSQTATDRGTNKTGIHIEMSGRARQTREEWYDNYSNAMLINVEKLVAKLCKKLSIPIKFIDAHGLLRGEKGITTHNESRKAFKMTTHTDPGGGFPMKEFIQDIEIFWFDNA